MEYRCTAAVSKRRTSLEYCDVRPNQRMQQPRARFALAAATPYVLTEDGTAAAAQRPRS
jgi:hypothetical protein